MIEGFGTRPVSQFIFQSTASSFVFGTAALLTKPGQTFAPLIGTFLLTKLANHNFKEVSDFATDKTVSNLPFLIQTF